MKKTPQPRIEFNHDRREVFTGGKERYLAPAEYGVLKALFETGKCLSRHELAVALGHSDESAEAYADGRVIDQHIARLRRKIGPGIILTVQKSGYKLSSAVL